MISDRLLRTDEGCDVGLDEPIIQCFIPIHWTVCVLGKEHCLLILEPEVINGPDRSLRSAMQGMLTVTGGVFDCKY